MNKQTNSVGYKVIVLDFDGVVLESAGIKTEAFRKLFQAFPDQLDSILDYHVRNAGVSRYKKFQYIYEHILRLRLDEKQMLDLGRRFSRLVLSEIMEAPFVVGASEFLRAYSNRARLYIASGTPQEELRRIVEARGLGSYFIGVYGAPSTKTEILQLILQQESADARNSLFIGDSATDFEASREVSVPFIGRVPHGDDLNPLYRLAVRTVRDLRELDGLLNSEAPSSHVSL